MLRSTPLLLALVFSLNARGTTSVLKSVYTDVVRDCVEVSRSNESSEIDFSDSECKAFGGFALRISGGDLRYGPELKFGETEIDLHRPAGFHDLGSEKIEWVYERSLETDGSGTLIWKGLIYRLSETDSEGKSSSILYAVRLDGAKSCLIGKTKTNAKAHDLVRSSKPDCK